MSVFFLPPQTEKELSKLMSRAMNEGLEGLVLKDINVMWQIDLLTALQVCMLISQIAALECN